MNSFLLVKANEKAAFCQPCLSTENLATTLVDSLFGRADVHWPSPFNLITCEEVKDLDREEEMVDQAQTVKKVKEGYMTPVKRVEDLKQMDET